MSHVEDKKQGLRSVKKMCTAIFASCKCEIEIKQSEKMYNLNSPKGLDDVDEQRIAM